MSTLCSLAILRTSGDERSRMRSSVDFCPEAGFAGTRSGALGAVVRAAAGGAAAGEEAGACSRGGAVAVGEPFACAVAFGGSGAFAAAWRGEGASEIVVWAGAEGFAAGGSAATALPAPPITATTLFTGTVSPSWTRISDTTPAAGDGISASTLSVEISKSGSSRSTLSPTFLIQRTIVPSAIDSPICGITTSVAIICHSLIAKCQLLIADLLLIAD